LKQIGLENLSDESFWTRFGNQELVMDGFGYSRCVQCDEEYFLQDGARCARCLGLSYVPIDDEDTEEESSSISLDRLAA
jgi:hypothetical protein